jgi:hypothetical protein
MRKLSPTDYDKIFEGNGPLSTFSSKILMGYGLRLYGPDFRHDLEIIKDIRNGFAHVRLPLLLTQPEIAGMCQHLRMAEHPELNWLPVTYSEKYDLETAADDNHPRTRFTRACHTISLCLLELGHAWQGIPGGVERTLP